MRGSFFCEFHKAIGNKQAFKYRSKTLLIDLTTIKPKIGRIKSENLVIHDAFIDRHDTLLLLVDYSDEMNEDYFWVTSKQIMATKINSYIEQLKNFQKKNNEVTCNS